MTRRFLIPLFGMFLMFFPAILSAADIPATAAALNSQDTLSTANADQGTEIKGTKKFSGKRVSLDFQDASIKNIFRVITELSGVNIVAGEDVKGNITVHMKNVPWDQALETILDTNGLGMKRFGNVIAVFPLDKMKKAEEERLKEDVARGMKPQIAIEAKIIEANSAFARRIGSQFAAQVQSGNFQASYSQRLYSSDLVPMGRALGVAGQTYATNLAGANVVAPALGVIAGTAKTFLDIEISALEATGDVKVISSPKVTTLDNIKAYIKQGQEIPYIVQEVTSGVAVRNVTFKEAVLQLEVKPIITPDERISLEIKAKNDTADYATMRDRGLENPPINKNEVSSTLVVRDGDTVIVGGVRRAEDSSGQTGTPWFKDIPVLGWLFKYQETTKNTKELLIFITPRIVREGRMAEKTVK